MTQTVLLGHPAFFRIKSGSNPHTRNFWGVRKQVDSTKALTQWEQLKSTLEGLGVQVHIQLPIEWEPGLVFPANAGFRFGGVKAGGQLRAKGRTHFSR